MSVESIKSALLTKLNSCGHIDAVYQYETGKETGHPYAVLTGADSEMQFGDTIRNINNHKFAIRLYVERSKDGFGPSDAERIADEALDELFTALNADVTLSGTCSYFKFTATRGYEEGPESVRLAEVQINAVQMVNG